MIQGVRKALETRLSLLTPTWVTAWENVDFEPTPGISHQRVQLIPAAPVSEGVFSGSVVRHVGIMQVDVCTTREGGPAAGDSRAVAIQQHFKRGTSLSCDGATQYLWVPDQPTIGPILFEATWRVVFVTIPYNVLSSP